MPARSSAQFIVWRRRLEPRWVIQLELADLTLAWSLKRIPSAQTDDQIEARWLPEPDVDLTATAGSHDTVWDRGSWAPQDQDSRAALARGKLHFELRGDKLRGPFTLGRAKGTWRGRGKPWRVSERWLLARRPESQGLRLTNLDKLYFPETGITKGELLDYYRATAAAVLPYLADRPVVLKRYVDGIQGRSFFQHHAPGAKSAWLRTVRIATARRPRDYFLIDDTAALLYLINLGSIPLHLWLSRCDDLDRPDWCVIDLDPGEAGFSAVVELALAARGLCRSIELEVFVKTSGSSGLHLFIPLDGQCGYGPSRLLAELIARTLVAQRPDLGTTEPQPTRRRGRVFIDTMVNGRGRTIAAPLSVRAREGAPVSTPLEWSELTSELRASQYNIHTVPERLRSGCDPWRLLREGRTTPDLVRSLALLETARPHTT